MDGESPGQTAAGQAPDADAPNWPSGWRTVPEGTNETVEDAGWATPQGAMFFAPSAEAQSPIWGKQNAAAPPTARESKKALRRQTKTGRYSDRAISPYAGFWRRFWSLAIDAMTHLLVQLIVCGAFLLFFLAIVALINVADLGSSASFRESAHQYNGFFWVLLVVWIILFVFIWYRMIPRRMATHGATFGMEQVGIEARDRVTGHFIGGAQSLGRLLIAFLVGAITTAVGVLIAAKLVGVDVRARPLELGQLSVSEWFVALVVIVAFSSAPTLLMAVDRTHQSVPDKITRTVFKVEGDPSWWAVASFAMTLTALFPVGAVFGHIALSRIRHSNGQLRGRGLALYSLAVAYLATAALVVVAVLVFANGTTGQANTSTERQQQSLVNSLVPTQPTFPPDLVRLAPKKDGTYGTDGCQQNAFGSADITAETRYASPTASRLGLPAALSVWAGSYDDTADITSPSKVLFGDLTACTFVDNSRLLKPTVIALRPDARSVYVSQLPYEIASGLERQNGTLFVAMAVRGHVALMVTGTDQAQVAFVAESTIDRVP